MDEIVKDFLIESNENLDRLDQELVKLESDPSSKELLASIFRTIHTIKGSCGFLGFARLEKLAHAGENLLSRLRDGKLILTAEITSGLLAMVDAVRKMLSAIQASGQDGDEDYASLIEHLSRLQLAQTQVPVPEVSAAVPATPPAATGKPATPLAPVNVASTVPPAPIPDDLLADPGRIGGLLLERGQVRPEDLVRALEQQEAGRRRIGEILVDQGAVRQEDVLAAQRTLESRNPEAAVETIRVGVTLLDRLMNLVGELVLARNQLLQFSNGSQDTAFQALSQRMNLIASELQEEVMRTRMQPIGNIWNKFPRTVRDLALSCGKEVRVEMEGKETDLDRTIIEAIKDPLTHLVRNSVDHGIESPEDRKKAGKDPTGRLVLRAFHEGGQVNIEISDDGAGLNLERIRRTAADRGVVPADQAARMQDRDIFNLIFLPGFSTAEKVSNVSGRGVGMDVVKTNVEKIGGTVDVHSTPGKGTTVKVKIPLTLAIIPALMVISGGERFAIPQVSLLELVRLEAGEAEKGIEMVHGAPVYRLRGRLLPLVYLNRELQIASPPGKPADGHAAINIVVVQADGREFGLVVDEITDTEEIVVKPLGKQLKGISAYSGATIMGDGRVALILDILGLAQRAQVIGEARESALKEKDKATQKEETATDRQTLLLVQCGEQGRMAIPLSLVSRLEEFSSAAIELAGAQEVMQYRGQIMPLIRLSRLWAGAAAEAVPVSTEQRMQVVVYSEGGHSVGLIVDRIVDIVDEKLVIQSPAQRRGVLGSSVIQRRVTDLLDVPSVVRHAIPNFGDAPAVN
ncbi:MAG TPA: chemotaxis protein CheA [Candidatus Sulfotelmatobacter sp.]|jgi:two-component system chemotaxis sensor kinase CheA|nr:chemotaxis protein CheA [Candidatus Sulfotelmatobacter sp.]